MKIIIPKKSWFQGRMGIGKITKKLIHLQTIKNSLGVSLLDDKIQFRNIKNNLSLT